MKKTQLLIIVVLYVSTQLYSQSFQIQRYGIQEGLSHESTFTLTQDENGYVWVSTSQGLCRFDGQTFIKNFLGDTLSNAIVSASYKDSHGRIWFGHDDGLISVFDNNLFKVYEPEEDERSKIVAFAEEKDGSVLAMSQQHGMMRFNKNFEVKRISRPFQGMYVSQIHLTSDGNLFVGGFDGLKLFTYNQDSLSYESAGTIPNIPFTQILVIKDGLQNDSYWIGTEDEGLIRLTGSGNDPQSYTIEKKGLEFGLEYSIVNSLLIDNSGYVWVSDYGIGVFRFTLENDYTLSSPVLFEVKGGLQEEYIKDILKDDEGNIWFASQSNGISILRDQAFTFMDMLKGVEVPEISAISVANEDFWFGSKDGMLMWRERKHPSNFKLYSPREGIPKDKITALWQDKRGNLFVGFESSGVYTIDQDLRKIRNYFLANNSLGNSVNAIEGNEKTIWIATNDGVYGIDRKTKVVDHQTTLTGLPHNVVNDLKLDREGRLWLASRIGGIFCLNDTLSYMIQGSPKLEFVSLTEDANGDMWGATKGNGVIWFAPDSLRVFSQDEGLKSKYTYAINVDPTGHVWVGHKLGLSRINPETKNVVVFGPDMGFVSDIQHNAIDILDTGVVFFGTNDGLIVYDTRQAREDTIAPRLNLSQLTISDSIYNINDEIKLKYGTYKVRFDFVGINMSNPDQVTYKYKLDGFDDWSEVTYDTYAKYSRIQDGDYTFMLQACDGEGNCTGEVAMIDISVRIPIWKAWWFILSLFVAAVGTVIFIIKYRERQQKALQDYLETQLDLRTKEVIQQKEEIEVKNRDITDSINYAQRIQASILPPIQRLHHTFTGSFVFYQPRDIVSGDFYWYDKLDDDRFLIVCADSTGHGVPGAFMSMIGTTLIKDICLRPGVNSPSDVLKTLDKEVREALNQNAETEGANDGMDIIVAEINLKTNRFIVASAMRPVIIYKDGEQIYVKGSRSSVGGQLDDTVIEKEFSNETFDLQKGDIVYMFSDGYPDQFGGPLGRKFKMVRLKNLLRDIHEKPMEEQFNYVKSNFFLWKDELEQVDDVLFMGIKI